MPSSIFQKLYLIGKCENGSGNSSKSEWQVGSHFEIPSHTDYQVCSHIRVVKGNYSLFFKEIVNEMCKGTRNVSNLTLKIAKTPKNRKT